MNKVTVDITGVEEVMQMFRDYGQQAADALAAEMYQEAEGIMSQSKELTPVDTGTLRDSGAVLLPRAEGTTLVQELGFGGPAASYALYVHENTTSFHKVGMAKYLEAPFRMAAKNMVERIVAGMKRKLR